MGGFSGIGQIIMVSSGTGRKATRSAHGSLRTLVDVASASLALETRFNRERASDK